MLVYTTLHCSTYSHNIYTYIIITSMYQPYTQVCTSQHVVRTGILTKVFIYQYMYQYTLYTTNVFQYWYQYNGAHYSTLRTYHLLVVQLLRSVRTYYQYTRSKYVHTNFQLLISFYQLVLARLLCAPKQVIYDTACLDCAPPAHIYLQYEVQS